MSQIVPVTVPLTPTEPDSVTIPAATQILFWCRLTPVVQSADRSISEQQRRRTTILDSIFRHVDATLIVNGERLHLVHETIRLDTDETKEAGFWKLESPLPPGTHTATLMLVYDPEQTTDSEVFFEVDESVTPRVALHPDSTPLELGLGRGAKAQTRIRVVETERDEFRTTTDPLWNDRTVYKPK